MGHRIEGKLAAHDRHQFELKLGYILTPESRRNNYNIELYFFIPKSLGINRISYSKNYFFNDLQGYIRFKTPLFTFDQLNDSSNALYPLVKINALLETNPDRKQLIAEIKLFACIARVALRNAITQIRRNIKKDDIKTLKETAAKTCSGLETCLKNFRALASRLEKGGVHEDVRMAFRQADEYLGISVDSLLNSLHNSITDACLDKTLTGELNALLMPIITSEYRYRSKNGYAVYKPGDENELFLYRKGVLKKLITSILFLETHTEEGSTIVKDVTFGIAAGLAMLLFVALTIWAGRVWSATSLPFALVLILGYIAKDRIKDWCKFIFSKKMRRWFSDYKTDITDPATGRKIGICRQSFSFLPERNVPADVILSRRRNMPEDFWVTEDIIKYEKDVSLSSGHILKFHSRRRDITDIIRFNVHRFLDKMDEPYEIRRALNANDGNTVEFKCARVYHVNLILRLENELRRIRLILNQNGIKRIEEVK